MWFTVNILVHRWAKKLNRCLILKFSILLTLFQKPGKEWKMNYSVRYLFSFLVPHLLTSDLWFSLKSRSFLPGLVCCLVAHMKHSGPGVNSSTVSSLHETIKLLFILIATIFRSTPAGPMGPTLELLNGFLYFQLSHRTNRAPAVQLKRGRDDFIWWLFRGDLVKVLLTEQLQLYRLYLSFFILGMKVCGRKMINELQVLLPLFGERN